MFISNVDILALYMTILLYIVNYLVLPNKIFHIMLVYGLLISFVGWEYFWSIGFIPPSDNYIERAKLYNYTQITSSNTIHATINSIGDTAVLQTIFAFTNLITPAFSPFECVFKQFNPYFLLIINLIGVLQNCFIDFSKLVPITNNMSSAPLSPNPNCQHDNLICWNNQQIWIYYPTIIYFISIVPFLRHYAIIWSAILLFSLYLIIYST